MHLFLLFLSGIALFYLFNFSPAIAAVSLLLSSVFLFFRKRYLLLPVMIIGFLYAFLRHTPPPDISAFSGREVVIDCISKGPPHETSSGRFGNEAEIMSAADADTGRSLGALKGAEVNIISDEGLKQGFSYRILAKAGKDLKRRNPGMISDERLYAYLQEIIREEAIASDPVSKWLNERRDSLNRYLKSRFKSDPYALLSAIITGERSVMSEGLRDAFNASGLAHMLSISGTHFGLFSTFMFFIFRFVILSMPYKYLQRFTIYLTPSQAAAIISLPFMLFYLMISGTSIPALRSFIMINIFLLGLLIGRKGYWLNSLLFAAFLICLYDPSAILSLSFQLSFLAVLFIGISAGDREINVQKQDISRRIPDYLKGALMLSLSASLGTAPLVAYYFHYFSVISPAANLIITPFIGFALLPLSLLSAFIFIFTGHYPFQDLIGMLSETAIKGIEAFSSVPYADIKLPHFPPIVILLFYSGVIVYLRHKLSKKNWKKRQLAILPMASIVMFSASVLWAGKGLSVTYLDVGQGDSAVIEASGKVMAIDTGRTGRELSAYLKYLGKRELDALVLTHSDGDHSAGAEYVTGKFRAKEIWDNGLLLYPDSFKNNSFRHIERGDVIEAAGFTVHVLHPYKGFYTFEDNEAFSENNDSIVLKVTGRKNSFLFTADTAEEAEEDMLHLGKWLKSDVIKVAHHGSRTSTTEAFLNAVSPEIAVISVGRDNTYGHPHADTLERLNGMRMYRTDRDGAVKITETAKGLVVKRYKEFQFEGARSISSEWRNIKRLFAKW